MGKSKDKNLESDKNQDKESDFKKIAEKYIKDNKELLKRISKL